MQFREIVSRLTGVSSPVFGVSWNPPPADVTVARRVVTYLEDRRVLFADDSIEVVEHCIQSVIEIRHYLTSEIQQLGEGELSASLRAMRAACRKFLEAVDDDHGAVVRYGLHQGHWASWRFGGALGELRGVFGVHLARIAAQYGLDIEDQLARILPAGDGADDGRPPRGPRR